MCDFLSGVVLLDESVEVRSLTSHSATVAELGLKAGTYREFEWTGEKENRLRVRTEENDEHDENWYRACVLAHGNTRTKLLNWLFVQKEFCDWIAEDGNNLDLIGLTSADGLKLPDSVGGYLDLRGLTSADGLKLPKKIGGYVYLSGLTSADGLKLPDSVGDSLDLSGLTSADGLKLPDSVGGSLDLSGLTSADGLKLPKKIGGYVYLDSKVRAELEDRKAPKSAKPKK